MSRINVGIPPKELSRQHLLAEHREIKRIPNLINSGRYNMDNQPKEFTLGKGHVKFFYDKCLYLKNRYEDIYKECILRGYKVTYFGNSWNNVPIEMMNNYEPNEEDIQLIRDRIDERNKK